MNYDFKEQYDDIHIKVHQIEIILEAKHPIVSKTIFLSDSDTNNSKKMQKTA